MNKHIKSSAKLILMLTAILTCISWGSFSLFSVNALSESNSETPTVSAEHTPDQMPLLSSSGHTQYYGNVYISEVMFKNTASLKDCDGDFSDWIELFNSADTAVDLTGWSMADHEDGSLWYFPEITLSPGSYLLVFASEKNYCDSRLHTDFKLSSKNTVFLYDSDGCIIDRMECAESEHDISTIHDENGSAIPARHFTPGFANTDAGYLEYLLTQNSEGPLQINEVLVANKRFGYKFTDHFSDLVEIKNISDSSVSLSDYYLSNDPDNHTLWQFPDRTLSPNETVLIYCDPEIDNSRNKVINASFSLSAKKDRLYLTAADNRVIDFVYLKGIPAGGSYGRINNHDGWFYFLDPNPDCSQKINGYRLISDTPTVSIDPGFYEDSTSLTVELYGNGTIYYTLDGSSPYKYAYEYTEPITISGTTVIRCYCVEDEYAPSPVYTANYVINTDHGLPVLCITTDEPGAFSTIWTDKIKDTRIPGNISFYDTDGSFSSDCGIEMKGWTSLNDPKKSLGITFKGIFGSSKLDHDIFGNGITDYSSLSVRAGQDYPLSIIRNELAQTLCMEMTDCVITQNSKYCVLYVNGRYYGIYCLKDDISRSNYALSAGVSKNIVTIVRSPASRSSDFYTKYLGKFINLNMSVQENYDAFCSVFDINSVIDWFILEGYCANSDINGNLKYAYCEEKGLWQFIFFDLDWSFTDKSLCFNNVINSKIQLTTLFENLSENESFRRAVLSRYSEVSKTVLSDEHILELIDFFAEQISSEMDRERTRWCGSVASWENNIEKLRQFITDNDYSNYSISALCDAINATKEERSEYFG